MIEKTMVIAARGRLRRSRPHSVPAILAGAAAAVLASVATAAPITFLPGDLAVLYSVYPGLPNPNTGSTGGYTTPNITAGTTVLPINPNAPNPLTSPVIAVAGGSYP